MSETVALEANHLADVKRFAPSSKWAERDVARLMYGPYWDYETGTFKTCRECDRFLVPWSVDGRLLSNRVLCPEHTDHE